VALELLQGILGEEHDRARECKFWLMKLESRRGK
jgi:hypothetical protein